MSDDVNQGNEGITEEELNWYCFGEYLKSGGRVRLRPLISRGEGQG